MPSRFEVVPDTAAVAASTLSEAMEQGRDMAFTMIWERSHNSTSRVEEVLQRANGWFAYAASGFADAASPQGSDHSASDHALVAGLLLGVALLLWTVREVLLRCAARRILRTHGHAHYD